MPLVTTKQMYEKAYIGGYAIGGFNVNNMETIQGIVEAAEELDSPVVLQVSEGARKYAKQEYLVGLVKSALKEVTIPVSLHLDHGENFEICKACIDGGFTSIMIDGSKHNFEDNIKLTKKVVDYAHSHDVVVEGELGRIEGIEDNINVSSCDSFYTDPEQAFEFVEKTNVDSLAVAIGTSHGAYKYKGTPSLRFDILEKIQKKLKGLPIVLHGASSILKNHVDEINKYGGKICNANGVPEDLLKQACSMKICKVNIDSDIRLAFTAAVKKYLSQNPAEFDPRKYLTVARLAVKESVAHKITHVLGSNGKAKW